MALFKVFRGQSSNLSSQPKKDGHAYFCTDDGSFWIDYEDGNKVLQRKQIGDGVYLPADTEYVDLDTNQTIAGTKTFSSAVISPNGFKTAANTLRTEYLQGKVIDFSSGYSVTFALPKSYSTTTTETLATQAWVEQLILGGEW